MSHLTDHGFVFMKQGAEARLYSGTYLGKPTIIKERFPKSYRHPTLDKSITKERTKSEAKTILKCLLSGIRTPALYLVDYAKGKIYMEHVNNSIMVKDYIIDINNKIEQDPDNELYRKLLNRLTEKIGNVIGQMHKNNIIHGDLTTSNMLLAPSDDRSSNANFNFDDGEVVLIDFGLSHIDSSPEDKGVDLYVLERALLSTHSMLTFLFENILQTYKKVNKGQSKDILLKFEDVRARGRKRTMVG